MKSHRLALILGVFFVSFMFVAPSFGIVSAATPVVTLSGPRIPVDLASSSSLNWAGYAVTGTPGSITTVSGSFVQPSVTCSHKTTYAAFWAGIDGYNDNTVEQAGTLAECSSGSPVYLAWTEFYPAAPIYASWSPSSGDLISVTVTCSSISGGASCTATVKDVTTGNSYSNQGSVSGAELANAECIAERPAVGGSLTTLANFGTAKYGQDYTSVSGTCYAGTGNTLQAFGSFSTVTSITMVNQKGQTLASPSSLSSDGSSFTVTYASSSSPGGGHHGKP
ncbi:MAG: G1 family endopeptidase [Thaumarchaeota archaeon]|nr:G1 family endopeptidase [Nitrososphaerota archaeon]